MCSNPGHISFQSGTGVNFQTHISDEVNVRRSMPEATTVRSTETSWAMQMKSVSLEEPSRLVKTLTGAILGCGGWVLSRGASDTGTINMLFEFERRSCIDIYSLLVAAGVELSFYGHRRFTELCQCTRSGSEDCASEIASIDLEIQTFGKEVSEKMPAARVL
jgi:hypothetical protein